MQKIINALALLSFAVSGSVVAAGTYAYFNQDKLKEMVTSAITDALPIPEIPDFDTPEIPGTNSLGIPTPSIPF